MHSALTVKDVIRETHKHVNTPKSTFTQSDLQKMCKYFGARNAKFNIKRWKTPLGIKGGWPITVHTPRTRKANLYAR